MKRVGMVQSNYIPWKGYFDLINSVDEFILYDDAQSPTRDWRNRNMIKTAGGLIWLTIPVEVKGKFTQKIKDVRCADDKWRQSHWRSIKQAYSAAPYFKTYAGIFEELYMAKEDHLSRINTGIIMAVAKILGIQTKISHSMDYKMIGEHKTEKLLNYCKQAGATCYLSGPTAKDYFEVEMFTAANIEVVFYDYAGYPEYPQLYPPFKHEVSVLDLIFNCGSDSAKFMKSFAGVGKKASVA